MAADPIDLRGTTAQPRIDINDEGDVEYWAHRLGVSREALARAVARVGDAVDDVAAELARRDEPGAP